MEGSLRQKRILLEAGRVRADGTTTRATAISGWLEVAPEEQYEADERFGRFLRDSLRAGYHVDVTVLDWKGKR